MLRLCRPRRLKYLVGIRPKAQGNATDLLQRYHAQGGGAHHAANLPTSQRYFKAAERHDPSSAALPLRLGDARLLASSEQSRIGNLNDAHPLFYAQLSPREAGLASSLVMALKKLRIHQLTELQGALIPLMLKGKHIIAQAETGTGKSFGIALALLNRILRDQVNYRLHTCILVPTTELALQYCHWMRFFGGKSPSICQAAVDTTALDAQLAQLHNIQPHVLVGTPQRVADLTRLSPTILGEKLRKKIDCLVLDEADEVLAMPIRQTRGHGGRGGGAPMSDGVALVDRLLRSQPGEVPAQLVAASATIDSPTARLLNTWMRNDRAVRLTTSFSEFALPDAMEVYLVPTTSASPMHASLAVVLRLICRQTPQPRVLIFTDTTDDVTHLCHLINGPLRADLEEEVQQHRRSPLPPTLAASLHRKPDSSSSSSSSPFKSANRRGAAHVVRDANVLAQLQQGRLMVGVGEYAVSRGLHVDGVSHVIVCGETAPRVAEFVHCAGRTGRMGRKGDVVVLFGPQSARPLRQTMEALDLDFRTTQIDEMKALLAEEVLAPLAESNTTA